MRGIQKKKKKKKKKKERERERIYYVCEGQIDFVPQDHSLTSLGKPRDARRVFFIYPSHS